MIRRCLIAGVFAGILSASQPYFDRTHESKVFGEQRHYRIFLPGDYETSGKRFPVIYYFHGHSDRYTLEKYDNGLDTVPKIAAFVATHEAIVVAPDGYVARDYTGFYGGDPYDVRRTGGDFDYGEYFAELTRHIDATYRTLTSRRYRATSGLSMGGFMSLYLSARYPDSIGSASAFNPGPEFFAGEKGRRSLWRPKDHVLNQESTMIRLIRASGDYISQYSEETRDAFAIAPTVDFEYRQDEYHRHWATSIGETFEFHMRAFANPALDVTPMEWNYATAYRTFHVHGYDIAADTAGPGFISLEQVTQGGLRIRTRAWAPDGPQATCSAIHLTTAPLYHRGSNYEIFDYDLATNKTKISEALADQDGRLQVGVDCSGHQISFNGPGTGAQAPVLLPVTAKDALRFMPNQALSLPLRVFNPRNAPLTGLRAELSSAYPTVQFTGGPIDVKSIAPGHAVDLGNAWQVRFMAAEGDFARTRLQLKLLDGEHETKQDIDVLVAPENLQAPMDVALLDGRTQTFAVFHQTGNQGGGASIERTVTEGKGNGNGVLDAGEQATIWVKLRQGLDPFDKNNWCRAKVYSDSPWLTEVADLQEEKQREWTGAQNRTSVIQLSHDVPSGTSIPMILDCESWSFAYTPDVRYGKESLYQAFQFHRHYLFAWKWASHS